jgi:hypothetical protein
MQSINTRKKHHNADRDACFDTKIQILIVASLNHAQDSDIINMKMKFKQEKTHDFSCFSNNQYGRTGISSVSQKIYHQC